MNTIGTKVTEHGFSVGGTQSPSAALESFENTNFSPLERVALEAGTPLSQLEQGASTQYPTIQTEGSFGMLGGTRLVDVTNAKASGAMSPLGDGVSDAAASFWPHGEGASSISMVGGSISPAGNVRSPEEGSLLRNSLPPSYPISSGVTPIRTADLYDQRSVWEQLSEKIQPRVGTSSLNLEPLYQQMKEFGWGEGKKGEFSQNEAIHYLLEKIVDSGAYEELDPHSMDDLKIRFLLQRLIHGTGPKYENPLRFGLNHPSTGETHKTDEAFSHDGVESGKVGGPEESGVSSNSLGGLGVLCSILGIGVTLTVLIAFFLKELFAYQEQKELDAPYDL